MDFKSPRAEVSDVGNATVLMKSGDHLSVGYIDSRGTFHCFNISASHLVFLATHQQSEATLLIRPSTGVQFVPGIK
jgi:hypothetical protein